MPVPVKKITKNEPYEADGYTETVDYTILQCSNVDGNANKYYCIELQHSPERNDYRVYTEYGRIGNFPARDLREHLSKEQAEKEINKIVKSKSREKTKKRSDGSTHREKYEQVEVAAPTVGSPNIKVGESNAVTLKTKNGNGSHFREAFQTMDYSASVKTLLTELLAENIHNIQANTSVTVTRGGLETPLGPVTPEHLDKARTTLNDIQAMDQRKPENNELRRLNTKYFSLIPRQFGRRITDADLIITDDTIDKEYDLLRGMEAAVSVGDVKEDKDQRASLGLHVEELPSTDPLWNKLKKQVDSTRRHNDITNWHVNRIFGMKNEKEDKGFRNPDSDGPVLDLFHGSANTNILSIMMGGYYIPPTTASHVTGRMFGNGVYGASSSTKSLRYSIGLWGGAKASKRAFLFVVRFGMGKVYETFTTRSQGAPSGYHSIHAKAGRQLINDEYIVYNTNQTKNMFLIEMVRK